MVSLLYGLSSKMTYLIMVSMGDAQPVLMMVLYNLNGSCKILDSLVFADPHIKFNCVRFVMQFA